MFTSGKAEKGFAYKVKDILANEPGLSVRDLAERLETNRQYMAGALIVLEEQGSISHRKVRPARIYFTAGDIEHKIPGT
jgi:predicted transcriptional regulator